MVDVLSTWQRLSKEFFLGSGNEVMKCYAAQLKHTLPQNIYAGHSRNLAKTFLPDSVMCRFLTSFAQFDICSATYHCHHPRTKQNGCSFWQWWDFFRFSEDSNNDWITIPPEGRLLFNSFLTFTKPRDPPSAKIIVACSVLWALMA